jgi:hypothetical protein
VGGFSEAGNAHHVDRASGAGSEARCIPQLARRGAATEGAMFVIREILNCKPGRIRRVIEGFRTISTALEESGRPPLRLLTDVTGEPFWTLVVEASVEVIDDFFELERSVMGKETVQKGMADFHDLIHGGRREIYRVEG